MDRKLNVRLPEDAHSFAIECVRRSFAKTEGSRDSFLALLLKMQRDSSQEKLARNVRMTNYNLEVIFG